ncbi:hypothetical protein Vadar_006450 [Vaccinium darrowii]|nr:hypothetical protein Vadar_006450 [Vaccinium darrowii]
MQVNALTRWLGSSHKLPSQTPELSQSRHLTQPSSHDPAPETTMKRRGRGCAKGMKKWGTGAKLHVMFDNDFQPLGDEGTLLKGQLGTIVRNPHRVPLTYLDWDVVPEDVKNTIWKEIEWIVQKGFVQLSCVHIIADRNSKNRGFCGPAHRTGRTPFYQIRHEMSALGENTDKMSVFTKTRDENDPDMKSILEEFKKHLAEIPESLQTTEVRDKIFHEVLGEDGHGYCKTFGAGVPRTAIYGQSSSPSHASSSSTANEITRQVREATQEIEQRLSIEIEQRLTGEIEKKLTEEIE